jgi:hypothetical protein
VQVYFLNERNHFVYRIIDNFNFEKFEGKLTEIDICKSEVLEQLVKSDNFELKCKFLNEKVEKQSILISELQKFKDYYKFIPTWYLQGFKSEKDYQKKQFEIKLDSLKKQFKLKSRKQVLSDIVEVFTTSFSGKNGGFKHFNRSIDLAYCLNINYKKTYLRNKNLCVKALTGEVLVCRGNIDKLECV